MKSCAFFGHRNMNVQPYGEILLGILCDLVENKGVTQFYSDYRGSFNVYCARLVGKLKERYPQIVNTMVLSYIPTARFNGAFDLPLCFDDSVYLLERNVPYKFAITETNKLLIDTVDFVVAAVEVKFGGAYTACEYARKRKKPIVNVIDLKEKQYE